MGKFILNGLTLSGGEYARREEMAMFRITTHWLGTVTIFRCIGRLTIEHADALRTVVLTHVPVAVAALDLAEITALDAAGIGILVSVRSWAATSGVRLKLLNLTPRIEGLLQLCGLKSIFEICTVHEVRRRLCFAFGQSKFTEVEQPVVSPCPPVESESVQVQELW
jgi:anti-sigma B factor antagonist